MSKVIEFPTREKRIEKLLREELPVDLPSDAIEKLAIDLKDAAERINLRPKSFTLALPEGIYTRKEMDFVTRQVEDIVGELVEVIQDEQREVFNLIIRYHLLLNELQGTSSPE